jgi:uncharacterized protein (DUF58 family)
MLGALLLFLVGTNVQSGWVFVLSALLLGVAVAGAVLPFGVVRGVAVARRAPSEAYVGDEVRVDLLVLNPTKTAKPYLSVRDPFIGEARVYVPSLAPGESVTLSTSRVATRRGGIDAAPVVVRSSAPFGVAEVRRTVPAGGGTTVFPRIVPVDGVRLLGDRSLGPEQEVARGRGPGHEFHGIREYQHGDSLRHVHWPSTARHGSLVVREFERERPAQFVVVVDTAGDTPIAGEEETALDRCCSVAGSAVVAALRLGHGVTVAAARDGNVAVEENAERRAALTLLAELRAPGGLSLARALDGLPAPPAALVAFPTWRSNAASLLVPAVERLIAQGTQVAAVAIEVTPARSLPEPALTEREVDELTAVLGAAGAEVHRIRPGQPVGDALAGALVGSRT